MPVALVAEAGDENRASGPTDPFQHGEQVALNLEMAMLSGVLEAVTNRTGRAADPE